MVKIKIVTKLIVEGIHQWSNCDIDEVDYLKYPHRHNFYIKVIKEVSHGDRDIEIIQFKKKIINSLNPYYEEKYKCYNFKDMSCEMIANQIHTNFNCDYVEVLEDNENGAIIC